MSFKRSVALVVRGVWAFFWPDLINTALTVLSDLLGTGGLALSDNIEPGTAEAFLLRFGGFSYTISFIAWLSFFKVGCNQVVLEGLMNGE